MCSLTFPPTAFTVTPRYRVLYGLSFLEAQRGPTACVEETYMPDSPIPHQAYGSLTHPFSRHWDNPLQILRVQVLPPWSLLCRSSVWNSCNFLKKSTWFKRVLTAHLGSNEIVFTGPLCQQVANALHHIIENFLSSRWKCPEEQNRDLPILRSSFQRSRHSPKQSEIPRDLPLCCWTVEIWLFLIVKVAQAVKNLPATQEALCSIPGSGSSPGEGNDKPLQYSCLGNSDGRRSLVGYSPCGHKPWWAQSTTEWLTLYFYCETGEWRDFCFRLDDSGYILARVAHLSLCLKPGVPAYLFFYGLLWASSSRNDVTGTQRSPLRRSQLTVSHCKCRKACASLEGRISMSSFSSHLL